MENPTSGWAPARASDVRASKPPIESLARTAVGSSRPRPSQYASESRAEFHGQPRGHRLPPRWWCLPRRRACLCVRRCLAFLCLAWDDAKLPPESDEPASRFAQLGSRAASAPAFFGSGARWYGRQMREAAVGACVVELEEVTVVVFGGEDVEGGEVDIGAVRRNTDQTGDLIKGGYVSVVLQITVLQPAAPEPVPGVMSCRSTVDVLVDVGWLHWCRWQRVILWWKRRRCPNWS